MDWRSVTTPWGCRDPNPSVSRPQWCVSRAHISARPIQQPRPAQGFKRRSLYQSRSVISWKAESLLSAAFIKRSNPQHGFHFACLRFAHSKCSHMAVNTLYSSLVKCTLWGPCYSSLTPLIHALNRSWELRVRLSFLTDNHYHVQSFVPWRGPIELHSWCKQVCGMYNPTEDPMLVIGKGSPWKGSSRFPLSIYEWSCTIANCKWNMLRVVLSKTLPSSSILLISFLINYNWVVLKISTCNALSKIKMSPV